MPNIPEILPSLGFSWPTRRPPMWDSAALAGVNRDSSVDNVSCAMCWVEKGDHRLEWCWCAMCWGDHRLECNQISPNVQANFHPWIGTNSTMFSTARWHSAGTRMWSSGTTITAGIIVRYYHSNQNCCQVQPFKHELLSGTTMRHLPSRQCQPNQTYCTAVCRHCVLD